MSEKPNQEEVDMKDSYLKLFCAKDYIALEELVNDYEQSEGFKAISFKSGTCEKNECKLTRATPDKKCMLSWIQVLFSKE